MQPDSTAALLVALGNLFAREERWADAQEAYFRAHTVDSGNADIIVNLAVSLDHLHRSNWPRQFYQEGTRSGGRASLTIGLFRRRSGAPTTQ